MDGSGFQPAVFFGQDAGAIVAKALNQDFLKIT